MHARIQSPAQFLANSMAAEVFSNSMQLNEVTELLVAILNKLALATFPTSTLMQRRL